MTNAAEANRLVPGQSTITCPQPIAGSKYLPSGGSLVLAVATSWVCVAQLARAAEKQTEKTQGSTVVPLLTVVNTSAWLALCIPYALRRREHVASPALGGPKGLERIKAHLTTESFSIWQPPRFLAIAILTNFCYIAAMRYLPASLNTAIFCTSPIFTLFFTGIVLPKDPNLADTPVSSKRQKRGTVRASLSEIRKRGLSVALSIFGVLLIAEPWHAASEVGGGGLDHRLTGAALSLCASIGTAVYQVYFKWSFGTSLSPYEVGLFLSCMGAVASVFLGGGLAIAMRAGLYPLDLMLVPWGFVGCTAVSSMAFNFLIKFGISVDGPVAMSLATQIGIPMNVVLDVLVAKEDIDLTQVCGTILMLVSFTLQQKTASSKKGGSPAQVPPKKSAKTLEGSGGQHEGMATPLLR
mmetsp:Transcript_23250/g.51019  ORF Transcript_23250/g.51019 Transcript_23250/m.51019 type:complete len:410 (+) Transcript_23250:228-1457(+)